MASANTLSTHQSLHIFRLLILLLLTPSLLPSQTLTRNRIASRSKGSSASLIFAHAHAVPDPNPLVQPPPTPSPTQQSIYIVLDVDSSNTDSLHFAINMYQTPIFTSNGFVTGSKKAFGLHTLSSLGDELVNVVGARVEDGPEGVICYVSKHAYDGKGGFSRLRPYKGYMKAKYVACVM